MLPSTTTIASTKEELYKALQSRNITEINSDPLPENPKDIDFGVLIDDSDEQSWTTLEEAIALKEDSKKTTPSRRRGSSIDDYSLQLAGIKNNNRIAFRFNKADDSKRSDDDELDPGDDDRVSWDVVLPALDEEEGPQ